MIFFEKKNYKNYIIIALALALLFVYFSGRQSSSPTNNVQVQPSSNVHQNSGASNGNYVVKKSSTGICHAPGTTYYAKTKNFTAYDSIQGCLDSGGRLPLR